MIINYDINNHGGGASAEGCVRYDQEQELTEEQQAQAKENLGIEDPEPLIYEVSGLADIPAETANQIHADYVGGKTVLVKVTQSFAPTRLYSVVSAKTEYTYNRFTLSDEHNLYELKSNKLVSQGELATLTTTSIPTVNNPTVTIKQGGTTKGSFTLNQSGDATINLDGGFSFEDLGYEPYDSESYYNVGDVVIYQGNLQRFVDDPETEDLEDCLEPVTVEQLIGEAGLSFEELGFERFSPSRDYDEGDVIIYKNSSTGADVLMVALVDRASDPGNPTEFAETSVAELIKNSGGGSPEGCVRYDEAQDLDENQQAQARENIGAVGGRLFELEGNTLEDMTAEEFLSIYGFSSLGCEALVFAGNSIYKALAGKKVMTRNYDDLFLYFLNSDGTIEEICLHNHYNPEIEFRKLSAAENHQLLKSALSEAMGCSANTWHTLCEVTVPEDGVYQVSASVRAQPYSESTYSAVTACIEIYDSVSGATELQEIQLPRSGEYGTMSVPVEVQSGKTIRLRAYSAANFYAQAAPSVGKASATFIAAVRIGAIYQA